MARLFAHGRILGHKRAKRNSDSNSSIIAVEGVQTKNDTDFYLGKRVAYVYKAKTIKHGSRFRCIWGRITRSHGNSGKVKAKFTSNIPPAAFGERVRIMLYPSRV
ncbi:ribosomal protein L35Ae [Neoconidiobolus thromboides FSU 785]|nr:ribosomal protein L35Ae [Neoconidiobolus thromboides FSU 785]